MKIIILLIAFVTMPIYLLNSEENHTGHGHDDGHNHKEEASSSHHENLDQKHGDHGHGSHGGIDDTKKHEGHGSIDEPENDGGHTSHAAHDDHAGHGSSKAIGKGKAVEEVHEDNGFKLSKEAFNTLKIKVKSVKGKQFNINKAALVASKKLKGVYRYKDGFFKLLKIKIIKEKKNQYFVEALEAKSGDEIVISGVGLLRITDVYSTDESEYGHSH